MARKKAKSAHDAVSKRIDAILRDVRACLLACAEERADCLAGCSDDQAAGRKCRIACYRANAACAAGCRRKLESLERLLKAAIAKEMAKA